MKRYQQLQIAPYELPFCFCQILSGHNTGMLVEAVRHSSDKNLHFSHSIFFLSGSNALDRDALASFELGDRWWNME